MGLPDRQPLPEKFAAYYPGSASPTDSGQKFPLDHAKQPSRRIRASDCRTTGVKGRSARAFASRAIKEQKCGMTFSSRSIAIRRQFVALPRIELPAEGRFLRTRQISRTLIDFERFGKIQRSCRNALRDFVNFRSRQKKPARTSSTATDRFPIQCFRSHRFRSISRRCKLSELPRAKRRPSDGGDFVLPATDFGDYSCAT